jgi:hypothetical protein
MDLLSTAFLWLTHTTAAWLMAGIVAGVGVTLLERYDRKREPTDEQVRRTTEQYRLYYGKDAANAVADHMLGAALSQDSRHRRFLKRVSTELLKTDVTDEDRVRAMENGCN